MSDQGTLPKWDFPSAASLHSHQLSTIHSVPSDDTPYRTSSKAIAAGEPLSHSTSIASAEPNAQPIVALGGEYEENESGGSSQPQHERWPSRVSVDIEEEGGDAPWQPAGAQDVHQEGWGGGHETVPMVLPDPGLMRSTVSDRYASFRALPEQDSSVAVPVGIDGGGSVLSPNSTLLAVQSFTGPSATAEEKRVSGPEIRAVALEDKVSAVPDTMADTVSTMLQLLDIGTSPTLASFRNEAQAMFGDGKGKGGMSLDEGRQLGPLASAIIGRWHRSLHQSNDSTEFKD